MTLKRTRRAALTFGILSLVVLCAAAQSAQVPSSSQSSVQQQLTPPVSDGSFDDADSDLENCRVHRVTGLPGSHQFASDFIETIASDPLAATSDSNEFWGLTADLSSAVPNRDQALYISKSSDGGATWTQVARIGFQYFNSKIGEGLRNGFIVAPGGSYFVVTTQLGAFQVFPQSGRSEAVVKPITGPLVPNTPPKIPIPKKPGEPVRANVVEMTPDGNHLIIGYGYFDLDPKLLRYRRGTDGGWVEDRPVPQPPTDMDLLSMQFDQPGNSNPAYLYLGTGDQVYMLNLRRMTWSRVDGVGPDSAIHGMNVVGGVHLAACWGVYLPSGPGIVRRVTKPTFLLHRSTDEAGSNLRAYSIEVDPARPEREVVTSLTGVYVSRDKGESWRRINDLPQEEFRTAHINADGSVLVSGIAGTFLINPFSDACIPRLKRRK